MTKYNPSCLGEYNFDNIALYARKRFIEGCNTIDLLLQARSSREKEEISLVPMMNMSLDESSVENLKRHCRYAEKCQITNCRKLIKQLIENGLAVQS